MKQFHLERLNEHTSKWVKIPLVSGPLQYCLGYAHCYDSMYPSPPIRIVETSTGKVRKEFKGRAAPHTNAVGLREMTLSPEAVQQLSAIIEQPSKSQIIPRRIPSV